MNSQHKTLFKGKKQDSDDILNQNEETLLRNSNGAFNTYTKNVCHEAGVRDSKQTLSTDYSFRDDLQNWAFGENLQRAHDFTFYNRQIQKLQASQHHQLKNKYKYSNKSVQCVIFYALLFNHLHLQEVKENVPKVTSSSLKCYNLIKKSLLSHDQIIAKQQLQSYLFPQSAFRLIQNKSLNLINRKQWIQNLIEKIEPKIVSNLVQILADHGKSISLQDRQEASIQSKVQELTNTLGVRIKYECQFKISSFGKKNSRISLYIQYQPERQLFQLKKINCEENKL